jgi:aspartate aminotransferase
LFTRFSCIQWKLSRAGEQILKKAVVTVPGKEFRMEGHLRLSFAGTVKEILEGIERIKWVVDPAPNEITSVTASLPGIGYEQSSQHQNSSAGSS